MRYLRKNLQDLRDFVSEASRIVRKIRKIRRLEAEAGQQIMRGLYNAKAPSVTPPHAASRDAWLLFCGAKAQSGRFADGGVGRRLGMMLKELLRETNQASMSMAFFIKKLLIICHV